MLPNSPLRSQSPRPTVRRSAAADRVSPTFSRVAEAHGVTSAWNIDRLLDQLPVGVLLVDRDARVAYANAAGRAMRVERLEPLQWAVTRALLTEDTVREDEIEVAEPRQPRRRLCAHVMPVRVAGFGVNGAIVTVSDVTATDLMNAWKPVIESLVNPWAAALRTRQSPCLTN